MRRSATELARLVATRQLAPSELVAACLAQVERYNGAVNAVCTLSERALDDARALDDRLARGEDPGPLCGLPAGIKDVTPTAGLRTTYGCPVYAQHVPAEDALVVQRLKAAGAVVLGKTNTPEFATGGNTFNPVFGRTRNPWHLGRSAGGSTGGGAAALATGMIALAEGTDLGGSLRIPASFCGVVGLRPSPGVVPTWPSDFLWDTLQVTGPMARTAEDVALMLDAVSGPSPRAPLARPKGRYLETLRAGLRPGLKVAYCPDIAGIGVDPEIEALCRRAAFELRQLGVEVEEIHLDLAFARPAFLALRGHWMVAHQHHRLHLVDQFGDNLAGNIRAGLATATETLGEAEQARGRVWEIFHNLLQHHHHLLTPCMVIPPFPVEENYPRTIAGKEMQTYIDWVASTFVLSLTGLPVASVPCGLDPHNLPAALQLVGPPDGEGHVLALAHQLQQACPIGLPPLPPRG